MKVIPYFLKVFPEGLSTSRSLPFLFRKVILEGFRKVYLIPEAEGVFRKVFQKPSIPLPEGLFQNGRLLLHEGSFQKVFRKVIPEGLSASGITFRNKNNLPEHSTS